MAINIVSPKKRLAVKVLNLLVKSLLMPIIVVRHKRKAGEIKRILLVRLDYIGDVIIATGAIKACRDRYPKTKIVLLAPAFSKALLSGFPDNVELLPLHVPWWRERRFKETLGTKIRSLLGYLAISNAYAIVRAIRQIRKFHPDVAIDLRGDFRNIFLFLFCSNAVRTISYSRTGGEYLLTDPVEFDSQNTEIENNQKLLARIDVDATPFPHLVPPAIEDNQLKNKFPFVEKSFYIVHPKADGIKNWSADKFAELIQRAATEKPNCIFAISGTETDRPFVDTTLSNVKNPNVINICGKTTLKEFIKLISKCIFVLSCDTGVSHIAQALNVPIIVLFGPTSPKRYTYSSAIKVIEASRPCGRKEGYNHSVCSLTSGTGQCMQKLNVEEVLTCFKGVVE